MIFRVDRKPDIPAIKATLCLGESDLSARLKVHQRALEALEEGEHPSLQKRLKRKVRNERKEMREQLAIELEKEGISKLNSEFFRGGKLDLKSKLVGKQGAIDLCLRFDCLKRVDFSGNRLSALPREIGQLKSLTHLVLRNNDIKVLPGEIGELTALKELILMGNQIELLPPELGKLKALCKLDLRSNKLLSLPEEIGELNNLDELTASNNRLESLPVAIGKLSKLTTLFLAINRLTELPEEIGELHGLTNLVLGQNKLQALSGTIGNLTALRELDISGNKLKALPTELGRLRKLIFLYSSNNLLSTVPQAIEGCQKLREIDLRKNALVQEGPSEVEWGRVELIRAFGNRVLTSEQIVVPMSPHTTKESVYNALKANPLFLGSMFCKIKLVKPEGSHAFSYEEMRDEFVKLFASLNLDDEKSAGYVSTEEVLCDWNLPKRSNRQLFQECVVPKLMGYLSALYDRPLNPGEVGNIMMMHQAYKAETAKSISYIISNLSDDPDVKAIRFTHLARGIILCQTGQSEAIDAVEDSILEPEKWQTGLERKIQNLIARQKNSWFRVAVLSQSVNLGLNVHLIGEYRRQLKEELGLTFAIESYQDQNGIQGEDPFVGNKWNVLKVYYQLVTPHRIKGWLKNKVETVSDRIWIDKRDRFIAIQNKKMRVSSEDYNARIKALEDKIEKAATDSERESLKAVMQAFIQFSSREQKSVSESENQFVESLKKELGVKEEELLAALRGIIKKNSVDRPITTGDLIYLMYQLEIPFEEALSEDMTDPLSIVTDWGFEELLVRMGILERA